MKVERHTLDVVVDLRQHRVNLGGRRSEGRVSDEAHERIPSQQSHRLVFLAAYNPPLPSALATAHLLQPRYIRYICHTCCSPLSNSDRR